MNEKIMNQLIEMAVKSARRINKGYSNNKSTTIDYNLGAFDSIINILNFFNTEKLFTSETDENYEKIKSIIIKEYENENHSFITTKTIKI